jgi:hypothetical protein
MHNTERLHLPIIQCLANDNSPMFIDPYNTGTVLHGHCCLLYCTGCVVARSAGTVMYSTAVYYTVYGLRSNSIRDAGTVQRRVQHGTV